MKKIVHKMKRYLNEKAEYQLCTKRRHDFSEKLAYQWNKVTCRKCLAIGGRGAHE